MNDGDVFSSVFNVQWGAFTVETYVCISNTYNTPRPSQKVKGYIKCEGETPDGDVLGAFDVNTGASVWNSTIHSK